MGYDGRARYFATLPYLSEATAPVPVSGHHIYQTYPATTPLMVRPAGDRRVDCTYRLVFDQYGTWSLLPLCRACC